MSTSFAGLDLLATATLLLDARQVIRYANPAAENLFAVSQRLLLGQPVTRLLGSSPELSLALNNARDNRWGHTGHNLSIPAAWAEDGALHLDYTVTPVETIESCETAVRLLLEFRPIDQQLKVAREERLAEQQQVSRELIRNLAHEIKNPLGGIRGSAQLLERELATLAQGEALCEYTQVIIDEADRLQALMQRLLSSHRTLQPAAVNIHEILERVRRLILAEFTEAGITVRCDYDTSLPDIVGDPEQLIQALLNIARNAAQALSENPHQSAPREIIFRTRVMRQVTLAKRRHRLAVAIHILDNGPGIPDTLREQIFYPLVSGRSNGSGLGLTLAQSFIHQHHGSIEVDSHPGQTTFTLLLPLETRPMAEDAPLSERKTAS